WKAQALRVPGTKLDDTCDALPLRKALRCSDQKGTAVNPGHPSGERLSLRDRARRNARPATEIQHGRGGVSLHRPEVFLHHGHDARVLATRLQTRGHRVQSWIVELVGDAIHVNGCHASPG